MQVSTSNNVKIYNLSCGKSLPDWLSERKRRMLQKKNVDIRRRIELIQDFDMPGVSTGIRISRDGNYIIAAGVYKPRIRCYDVNNLSMKFERCFNAETVQFELLDRDYSKIVLLQCDRTVEFHAKYGSYYKTRIPKFGRDLAYHHKSADLYLAGASSEIYRLNLEQGRFLKPLQTNASSINKICINAYHNMIACGTMEGKVEAWDLRSRQRIETLDCALSCVSNNTIVDGFPAITSISFKDALTIAVGTFTGQVLLYDTRTNKPFLVKDQMYGLPIKNIEFVKSEGLVASMDPKCVKFWNQSSGKPYTTIQAPAHLNDMCFVPDTGLLFLANEDRKIMTYFIPSLGPAPKWCSFLDSMAEELEESKQDTVFDDYKFVTKKELGDLNLEHLHGTNLLRAYMHGYFMDIRLYNKAKAIAQPIAYENLKIRMLRSKVNSERKNQVIVKQLPSINREYALKLMEKKDNNKSTAPNLYEDSRFKAMFENPDFQIDEAVNNDRCMGSTSGKSNKKALAVEYSEQFETLEEEDMYKTESSERDESDSDEEYSSPESNNEFDTSKGSTVFAPKDSERFSMLQKDDAYERDSMLPLGDRLESVNETFKQVFPAGNKVVTFSHKKPEKHSTREDERKAHLKERLKYRRPAKNLRK